VKGGRAREGRGREGKGWKGRGSEMEGLLIREGREREGSPVITVPPGSMGARIVTVLVCGLGLGP